MPHCYVLINQKAKFDGNFLTTFKVIVKNFWFSFCGHDLQVQQCGRQSRRFVISQKSVSWCVTVYPV